MISSTFNFATLTDEEKTFLATLDAHGEVCVAANVTGNLYGEGKRTLAIAWLAMKERQRQIESSTDTATAAKATRETAKWTFWVAVATFITALVTAVASFKQ